MNFISSVTSGMNFNFGSNFFNNANINSNNDVNYEDNEDSDEFDFEEGEEDEENEENEDDAELFNRKKKKYIMNLYMLNSSLKIFFVFYTKEIYPT